MTETSEQPDPNASCEPAADSGHGRPGALSVEAAHARIAGQVEPVTGTEKVPLRRALGRVLAEDLVSTLHIPPDTNSAMDGYAFRGSDLDAEGRADLRLVGTAWAGHPLDRAIGPGEAAQIMTGAPLPQGADSVVMQERTVADGERVRIAGGRAGDNVRSAGEDLSPGDRALPAGQWIGPAELGVIASLGRTEVPVHRRPRVGLFATGDELMEPGQPLPPGCLYDSNRYTVWGMLTRLGMAVDDRGHLPDERAAVEASLTAAAEENDAVITTGGVSVGAADHVAVVLREQGDIGFWQITMKPGRPLNFGRLGGALFFGLPGNPVSAMVTFYQLVQPALRALGGAPYRAPIGLRARALSDFPKKPGRTEYQRAELSVDEQGEPVVARTGSQGSGRLTSMARANCFVVVPAESDGVGAGSWIEVQPFHGLV